MAQTMEVLIGHDDEGEEIKREVPCKMEVCSRCEGHGTHLNPSIGEHAYTMEEFHESFDEEGREEYFKRGGIYDVTCEECHGANVVPVPDLTKLSKEDQEKLEKHEADEAAYRAECEAERRMGC